MLSSPDIVTNIISFLDIGSILNLLCVTRNKDIINMLYNHRVWFYVTIYYFDTIPNTIQICPYPKYFNVSLREVLSLHNTPMYLILMKGVYEYGKDNIYCKYNHELTLEIKLYAKPFTKECGTTISASPLFIDMRGYGEYVSYDISKTVTYDKIYQIPYYIYILSTKDNICYGNIIYSCFVNEYIINVLFPRHYS